MLCIIADDLTGALDAAAPFAGRGLSVRVAMRPEALPMALAAHCDVVAVSTQSREVAVDLAAARVAATAAMLPAGTRLFKKIDSRLKGHVAAELAALAPTGLLVAPAIPDFGRIVRNGAVCGFGVAQPVVIAPLLGDLAARAIIPDTADARQMREALADIPAGALLVGARGLAEALAVQMTGRAVAVAPRPRAARALMVVGSRDPITMAQVEALRACGADWRAAPNGRLPPDKVEPGGAALTLVQATQGADVAAGAEVALALAASVHPALTVGTDVLFLTGGATAEAVMQAMALDVLQLEGEVLPGVPLAQAGPCSVILKSGGFGGDDTLTRLAGIFAGGT